MGVSMTITITATTALTKEQMAAALALERAVHVHDHTFKDIYMYNQFNRNPEMKALFLAYSDGELVGVLQNYADSAPEDDDAELSVIVAPAFRQQGVATALIKAARAEMRQYGYTADYFVTEDIFLQAHPDFLARTGLHVAEAENEYQLSAAAGTHADYQLPESLQLRPMVQADIDALLPSYMEAFDDDETSGRTYLQSSLDDADDRQFVLTDAAGKQLGYCAIDTSESYYFFGLFVTKAARGRGIGTAMVKAIMAQLASEKPLPLRLAVEASNAVAHHVYLKAGFQQQTVVKYLYPNEA